MDETPIARRKNRKHGRGTGPSRYPRRARRSPWAKPRAKHRGRTCGQKRRGLDRWNILNSCQAPSHGSAQQGSLDRKNILDNCQTAPQTEPARVACRPPAAGANPSAPRPPRSNPPENALPHPPPRPKKAGRTVKFTFGPKMPARRRRTALLSCLVYPMACPYTSAVLGRHATTCPETDGKGRFP